LTGYGNEEGKRHMVMLALLSEPTIEGAAAKTGMSDSTIYRLMRDDAFMAELRIIQRKALGRAMARLSMSAMKAVQTLEDVMDNGKAHSMARVAASRTCLEFAVRWLEIDDLAARIEELERRAANGDRPDWIEVGSYESGQLDETTSDD
jgi:hypothetical protein